MFLSLPYFFFFAETLINIATSKIISEKISNKFGRVKIPLTFAIPKRKKAN
jgi:hypothetical protein